MFGRIWTELSGLMLRRNFIFVSPEQKPNKIYDVEDKN